MLAALLKAAGLIGPKAGRALRLLGPIIAANPEIMGRLQRLLEGLPGRAASVPLSRKRRVARSLDLARNVAGEILDAASDPETKERATAWLARAADLRSSLALVSVGARSARRERLNRVAVAVDELVADMISSGLGDSGVGSV